MEPNLTMPVTEQAIEQPIEQPIEHQNVPVAHRGLHDFLYSSDDEHAAIAPTPTLAVMTEDWVMPLEDWFVRTGEAKVAGVYGVFDLHQHLQYVNISRNVSLSLRGHQLQLGSELCAFVRVSVFRSPKRDEMTALQAAWIAENGTTPMGNRDRENPWAQMTGDAAIAAMSPVERAAYEEKKLKLRSAMADSSLSRELPIAETDGDRSQNTKSAVQSDDWSSVIQTQTQDTL
jgi:hypothetical protein